MSGMKSKRVVQAYRRFGEDGGLSIDDASKLLLGAPAAGVDEAETAAARPVREDWTDVHQPDGVEVRQALIPWEEFGPGGSHGRTYSTRDEAARAALDGTNSWSKGVNAEYRWSIYQDDDGAYRYTPPEYWGREGAKYKTIARPPGRWVGMGHTHGDYSDRDGRVTRARDIYDSDNFSSGEGGDREFMNKNAYGLEGYYLGTPSGAYYQWLEGKQKPF
jgi:hypothetical protein